MTISSTNRKAGPFAGNDVTVNFPFAFKVFSAADLYVVRADSTGTETALALTTNYTVALNADQDANPGGTVTLLAALATGYLLTLTSNLDYLQPTDLTNQGGFYPKVINSALDRLTIFIQQISEQLGRALKYSITSPLGDSALPTPVANNVIGWNETGNGFKNYAPVDNSLLSLDLASGAVSKGAALIGTVDGGTVALSLSSKLNRVVDSITALKALDKTKYTRAFVTGYYAAGDGGGGAYWYDSTDTTSADNGGTIIVATDGARWKLIVESFVTVKQFGAKGDNMADDTAKMQNAASVANSIRVTDGTYLLSSSVTMATPKDFVGYGAKTTFNTTAGFSATSIFSIAPASGTDPKGWNVSNFEVTNNGAATNIFLLDIAGVGEYLSKLTINKIISNTAVSGYFVELLNSIPNTDGLFTSVFEDNWSLNGYYLDNVGDSVILQRNTTTGAGYGYFVNQLDTASHILIKDGNCTSASGIYIKRGYNVQIDSMQIEMPVTFTGLNSAVVSATNALSTLITNLQITRNSINTQANTTLACVSVDWTDNTQIDNNTLYCNQTTGNHIVIGANARNTYIGANKYYSSIDGAEIAARITDSGVGTMGLWKAATLSTWTTLADPANGFPVGFFKQRDGEVMLRGNLTGAASTGGQTLFTLPSGFRPNAKVYTRAVFANGATNSQALIQILPTGEVQFVTAGATTVYLDGVSFSTR